MWRHELWAALDVEHRLFKLAILHRSTAFCAPGSSLDVGALN